MVVREELAAANMLDRTDGYYVNFHAQQKGPYNFLEIKRLYEQSYFPEETLYWQDGMEQWQPLAELCGPPLRVQQKKVAVKRIAIAIGLAVIALVIALMMPWTLVGWRETSQHEFTQQAAYWAARGFIRSELKTRGATVAFDAFNAAAVALSNDDAVASIPCTIFPPHANDQRAVWRVSMHFDRRKYEWGATSLEQVK
jgi:uncharacterized protein DUF4339